MTILFVSFLAGVLTVLAPCVLPLLPIILGSSVENPSEKYRPYIIILALSVSIILFSILLKATTLFIGFDTAILTTISGLIIIFFGIITLFPDLWKNFSTKIGFAGGANQQLGKSSTKKGVWGSILIGFSLGPVFSSCSPTYAIILAVILPVSFFFGFINLIAYVVGLGIVLIAIAVLGQRFTGKLKGLSDPKSKFKKILGVIFLIVGLAIVTGLDKKIETELIKKGFIGGGSIEQRFLDVIEDDVRAIEDRQ